MTELRIDPVFRDKIPPLSPDEFAKLEENILADGEVREPLVVWNGTIIDGHHRWQIIQKNPEIPYTTKEMDFANKWAAIVWMCHNQLGRRNVSDEQRTVLIGEAYKAQKQIHGGERGTSRGDDGRFTASDQSGHLPKEGKTKAVVAKQFGVGSTTVQRAENFVDGLDAAEAVSPGFKSAVLSGEVKAPKKVIAEIRRMEPERKAEVVQAIRQGESIPKEYTPVKNATPVEPRPAYDLDDYREELMAVVNSFDRSFRTTLELAHPEMLEMPEGRSVAAEVLKAAHEVINKYQNMTKGD